MTIFSNLDHAWRGNNTEDKAKPSVGAQNTECAFSIDYYNIDQSSSDYKYFLDKAEKATELVRSNIQKKSDKYQIFNCQKSLEQIKLFSKECEEIKQTYRNFVVIAMGGASLNPQTLVSFTNHYDNYSNSNIYFLDSTDPIYFAKVTNKLDLRDAAIIVISNSGNTLETISLTEQMIRLFQQNAIENLGKHFFFITNPNHGALHKIATNISARLIEHCPNISGRFSGLTNVSTFIGQIIGLDMAQYLQGAQEAIDLLLKNGHSSLTLSAAAILSSQKRILVNLSYAHSLSGFLEWYCQIIAESMGKNDLALTPLRGLGPNDQHSMLQLYIEGGRDKFFNLLHVKNFSDEQLSKVSSSGQYDHLQMVHDINFQSTLQTLIDLSLPVRVVTLPDLSLYSLGRLVANSMLETIIMCEILEVNPFDQPGVELIKTKAKKLLGAY